MSDVHLSFSLEEAKALRRGKTTTPSGSWVSACRKLTAAIRVVELREGDDEWVPTTERVTNEQVEQLAKLLALPWRESDLRIFADDDEPESREGDEQLVEKVAEAIYRRLADWIPDSPEDLARAAIAAVEEHREEKK